MCNKLAKVNFEQWNGFKGDRWKEKIDVRNFISMNYTPYDGDASFLEGPTEATAAQKKAAISMCGAWTAGGRDFC